MTSPSPLTSAPRAPRTRGVRRLVLLAVAVALVAAACGSTPSVSGTDDFGVASCNPSDCIVVPLATSPEKSDLLTQLAKDFNASQTRSGTKRIVIQPKSKASGGSTQLLAQGWDEGAEGPRPVIWSPAASSWGAVLDQRLAEQGKPAMAGSGVPFMTTPLTIAMPKPMAEALGWPRKELGWSDVLELANNPQGWAAYGHPEWGPFRLGKTNPNFSTSGLHALIAQNYAATGKTRDLTAEDLNKPDVVEYSKNIEAAVVHYGDTTLTFLNNWYRADQRGNPYSYASAVAVEEKSVIDYNSGNPDGVLDQGEQLREPRVPLVAIYPKEGTLLSDNPFFILNADWVSAEQRDAAKLFGEFVQRPENQQKVLQFNFRPGNPQVPVAEPIVARNGVDPNQPQTTLQVPAPTVMTALLDRWNQSRKGARVLLVVDVSGSMSEAADGSGGETKLDLVKQAIANSLDQFKGDDLVGLREFSTGLGPRGDDFQVDLLPVAPMSEQRERFYTSVNGLLPTNGTPLYDVAKQSFQDMVAGYDPTRINAVVLLTDGKNEDGNTLDDRRQLEDLTAYLQAASQGENSKPVRLFTIGYGSNAETVTLRQIAESTSAAYYPATDPKTINKVFTQVISNF